MNAMMRETFVTGTARDGRDPGLGPRRQDRHEPGFPRRLVRRLHRDACRRRLARQRRRRADEARLRRQPAGRDLGSLHEDRPCRPAPRAAPRGLRRVRRPPTRPADGEPAPRSPGRAPAAPARRQRLDAAVARGPRTPEPAPRKLSGLRHAPQAMLESARSAVHSELSDQIGRKMMRTLVSLAFVGMLGSAAFAQGAEKWVTSWAASPQGPYPIGNPSAQPNQRFAFPAAATGARDQTFRLIVQPDLWGRQVAAALLERLRRPSRSRSTASSSGCSLAAAAVMPGTNQPVRFGGQDSVTVTPGESAWSDPVDAALRARAGASCSRPQARGQLPRRRRERADDLAREGAADVLRHGAGRRRRRARSKTRRRSRSRPPPGSSSTRVDAMAAADTQVIVALRRFDHRRHRLDHERRRPLAGRPVATAARRLRQPRRGGERRHRRQPGRRPARILARDAVRRRPVGAAAARSRRASAFRASRP